MTATETRYLAHGLGAVLIPKGLPDAEVRALRDRLGLTCRHGRQIRSAYGRCPACATHDKEKPA